MMLNALKIGTELGVGKVKLCTDFTALSAPSKSAVGGFNTTSTPSCTGEPVCSRTSLKTSMTMSLLVLLASHRRWRAKKGRHSTAFFISSCSASYRLPSVSDRWKGFCRSLRNCDKVLDFPVDFNPTRATICAFCILPLSKRQKLWSYSAEASGRKRPMRIWRAMRWLSVAFQA